MVSKMVEQRRPCRDISRRNPLRLIQDGRHFAEDTFKQNVRISIKTSLEFIPKDLNNNIPALVKIMVWRQAMI